MVKSRKKYDSRKKHAIKSRRLQLGGAGSYTGFTPVTIGTDTTSKSLTSMRKLQDTSKQAEVVISAVEAPRWGTKKGASSYTKNKGNLIAIRRKNIENMENIIKILNKPSSEMQIKAISEIKVLQDATNRVRYQKILQIKRDVESNFKNVNAPEDPQKSQSYNSLSQAVHLARKNILQDIVSLVRTETLKLNSILSVVVRDKGTESFRDTDSSQ